MKRKFFSGEFLRMKNILFFIIFLFFIFNFNVSKASICANWSVIKQTCIYIITRENIDSSTSTKYLNGYFSKSQLEAEKEQKDLEKKLDKAIGEDPPKAIEDLEYIKKSLASITIENENRFNTVKDLLIDNKNKENPIYKFLVSGSSDENMYLIDDGLKSLVRVLRLNTLLIKFNDLLTYLKKKENSTSTVEKNSVDPKLKKYIEDQITYFRTQISIYTKPGRSNIHKIESKTNSTSTDIIIYLNPQNNLNFSTNWTEEKPKLVYSIPNDHLSLGDIQNPTAETTPTRAKSICSPEKGFLDMFKNPDCSLIAYLVNLTLKGLTSIFGVFLTLAGKLLDWAIGFSIYNFSDLVANSGAYEVWRKVILALVTSLLLPLVFYYIIRMLIDNDTDKIQKILPKILFTALFVYFSFTVVGFLIDQANILSIYIYRSLHSPDQSIASSMESLIIGDPSLKDPDAPGKGYSLGDWSAVPVMAIQLLMVGVGIMILFQAAILIFVRGVILILCLIFSPIMLLPSGIHSKIDEYRKKIIEYFTNSTIMAPVFLFLVLIAIKVGEAGSSIIINTDSLSTLSGTSTISGKLIGAAISGVISVIILQLAISTAKQLSGDIGNRISGKISSFIGNTALGGTARLTRMGASKLVNNKKFNGWISKGGTRGRLALKLQKSANNSTFDVRNNKTFAKATGNTFGKGSNTTINSAFEKRYAKEKEFYNRLNPEAQEKHIRNLRRGWTGTSIISNGNRVADRLEGKNSGLSFKEKMDTNKNFKNKFDKANKETDTDKRMEKIYESIDSHFKANGKGEKYFTKQMKKEKYTEEFKEKLEKINKDKSLNEEERKNKILDIVNKFEEKKKEERENAGGNTKDKKEKKKEKKASTNPSQSNTQGIKPQTNANLTPLRDRLAERQNRTGKTIGEEKSQSQLRRTLDLGKEAKDREEENKRYMADLGKRQEAADKLRDEREKAAVQKSVARQARKLQGEGVSKEDLPKTFSQAMTANNFRQMMRDSNLNSVTITKDTDPIKSSPITNNTTNNINITNSNTNSGVNVITPEANNKPNIVREIGGNSEQNQSLKELREMAHDLKINSIPVGNINLGTKLKTEPEKAERRVNVNSTRKDNLDGNNYINR